MCLIAYLGSSSVLSLMSSSALSINDLNESQLPVRNQLSLPNVYRVDSFEGCGCAFQQARIVDPDDQEWEPQAQASLRELKQYLRGIASGGRSLELYACWAGDEHEPRERATQLDLDAANDPDFGVIERELIVLLGTER